MSNTLKYIVILPINISSMFSSYTKDKHIHSGHTWKLWEEMLFQEAFDTCLPSIEIWKPRPCTIVETVSIYRTGILSIPQTASEANFTKFHLTRIILTEFLLFCINHFKATSYVSHLLTSWLESNQPKWINKLMFFTAIS